MTIFPPVGLGCKVSYQEDIYYPLGGCEELEMTEQLSTHRHTHTHTHIHTCTNVVRPGYQQRIILQPHDTNHYFSWKCNYLNYMDMFLFSAGFFPKYI